MNVTALAATGQLGTGFKEHTLVGAAKAADFIGCDAGSSDPGPYYLGSGETQSADAAVGRDLELMIREGLARGIPVLVGSAGTAGGRPHLERTVAIVRELAKKNDWHFRLGVVDSEIDQERVVAALAAGRLRPLAGAPEISADTIRASSRIVAMQGPNCFVDALDQGAQVVIAGRTSDTAIFAAIPMMRGIPAGVAFHAAKILECGAASTVERKYPDSMVARLDEDGFEVEPPNPEMYCTTQSVASHAFYETSDPFRLVEPAGTLVTTESRYEAVSERAVRVIGSTFETAPTYTVKLEAATLVGYRSLVIAGVRDPLVIGQIDDYVAKVDKVVRGKIADSLGIADGDYRMRWNVYGRNAVLGPFEPKPTVDGHEVAILIDIVADTQKTAQGIASIAWHTALHQPIPEYSGLVSNLAFPVSPPATPAGPVYEFSINHVMELDRPDETYTLTMEEV
jgi:hypothetical protein